MPADIPIWWEDTDAERALKNYLADRNNSYDRWKAWSVRMLLPKPSHPGAQALDYGCGGGEFTVNLAGAGWNVVAADASSRSLAACRLHVERAGVSNKVEFSQCKEPDYWKSIGDRQFDLILAKDVIEHIENDLEFLKQVKARLAPEGVAIIVTQNDVSWNYWLQAAEGLAHDAKWCGWDPTHVRFYNLPSLTGKLRYTGLKPIKWRSAYLVPYRGFPGRRGRISNFMQKAGLASLFYWPEFMLGGVYPFCGFGWSIAVVCKHA